MTDRASGSLEEILRHRFGDAPNIPSDMYGLDHLSGMAKHASCRSYAPRNVDLETIRLLCAIALSAPTKSDLQQTDIVILDDPGQRMQITRMIGDDWIIAAPAFLIFCGNNRRQRQIHEWRGKPFVNDHLDAFFNAAVDCAIVLGTFVAAAEAAGMGCCPVSAVRNHAAAISDLIRLPDHVFPVAGLTLGWPAQERQIAMRLPLTATVHRNYFDETQLKPALAAYDERRGKLQPYAKQRYSAQYGETRGYSWSEDKARQYSMPERADFGAFVRAKGFKLT